MLLEGVPAAMIENAARMAGMPVGPLALNDETGLDLGLKIVRAAEADLGPKAINQGQKKMFEDLVEKNAAIRPQERQGLLRLSAGPAQAPVARARRYRCPKKLTRDQIEKIDIEELKQRILATQAVEAARTFEEKVVTDVREADVGSILGWGFAPFTGGTLSFIDGMGTKNFVALCRKLEKKHGARFAPNTLLLDLAEKNETFYSRFAPTKAKQAA